MQAIGALYRCDRRLQRSSAENRDRSWRPFRATRVRPPCAPHLSRATVPRPRSSIRCITHTPSTRPLQRNATMQRMKRIRPSVRALFADVRALFTDIRASFADGRLTEPPYAQCSSMYSPPIRLFVTVRRRRVRRPRVRRPARGRSTISHRRTHLATLPRLPGDDGYRSIWSSRRAASGGRRPGRWQR